MKTKLSTTVGYLEELNNISNKKVTAKVLLAILHNIDVCEKEVNKIEDIKYTLQKQYALVDDNGEFVLDQDGQIVCNSDDDLNTLFSTFTDALNEEIDIDIHSVALSDLIEIDTNKYDILTPAEVQKLKFMITEE